VVGAGSEEDGAGAGSDGGGADEGAGSVDGAGAGSVDGAGAGVEGGGEELPPLGAAPSDMHQPPESLIQ